MRDAIESRIERVLEDRGNGQRNIRFVDPSMPITWGGRGSSGTVASTSAICMHSAGATLKGRTISPPVLATFEIPRNHGVVVPVSFSVSLFTVSLSCLSLCLSISVSLFVSLSLSPPVSIIRLSRHHFFGRGGPLGFTMTLNAVYGMTQALHWTTKWDYFINLSASDLPLLRTVREINRHPFICHL